MEGVNPRRFARGVDLARNLGDGLGQVFHLDALGSVQALSAADGSEITRYGVDPRGNVQSGSAAGNAYVYHGGLGYWEEPGAGLSYVRARWLEPETGNWLSVDPVSGEPRYVYARQMPTAGVDPSGTQVEPGLSVLRNMEPRRSAPDPDIAAIGKAVQRARDTHSSYPLFITNRPIGDGEAFTWTELPPKDRKALFEALLGPLVPDLRASARSNGIPTWLLATVILARISRFATSDPFGPQCGARIANHIVELLVDT